MCLSIFKSGSNFTFTLTKNEKIVNKADADNSSTIQLQIEVVK